MAPMKLLLVDDESDFLNTLLKRMKRRDVDVQGVDSGEAALAWLETNAVDVVILDVRMPGMDGIEALREIKQRHPLVEVIMLTGHASMEVAIEGMEMGAFDYLMKPMDMDELLYKAEDAFKKKTIHANKIQRMVKDLV
ncbi:response regulator [Desulfosarcina ovata]|uniref:Two-component system response regulator n=2 Tax=Desulfosarcina ovata TaxID=83564 RepID=A0A5K8A3S9_9BACT|nr:response regulator [Desulfosarcina ovata]BBO79596.1 two-component system response regulator [Desulfosarcina ovata subsp. sediminis]BBO87004.1 two-component system response regulator [Desulfosarcina ovata subsp. ovata]